MVKEDVLKERCGNEMVNLRNHLLHLKSSISQFHWQIYFQKRVLASFYKFQYAPAGEFRNKILRQTAIFQLYSNSRWYGERGNLGPFYPMGIYLNNFESPLTWKSTWNVSPMIGQPMEPPGRGAEQFGSLLLMLYQYQSFLIKYKRNTGTAKVHTENINAILWSVDQKQSRIYWCSWRLLKKKNRRRQIMR